MSSSCCKDAAKASKVQYFRPLFSAIFFSAPFLTITFFPPTILTIRYVIDIGFICCYTLFFFCGYCFISEATQSRQCLPTDSPWLIRRAVSIALLRSLTSARPRLVLRPILRLRASSLIVSQLSFAACTLTMKSRYSRRSFGHAHNGELAAACTAVVVSSRMAPSFR